MKKFISSIFFLFICCFASTAQREFPTPMAVAGQSSSYSQSADAFGFDGRGFYNPNDESKDYSVFNMPDVSASQIKSALFTRLSSIFKSPKDAITSISDNIIQLEGYAESVYISRKESATCPVDISFTLIIQIKDGRVRYNFPTIKQIYLRNFPYLGTARLDMSKSLTTLISTSQDRESVAKYFNKLVTALNSAINAENDW